MNFMCSCPHTWRCRCWNHRLVYRYTLNRAPGNTAATDRIECECFDTHSSCWSPALVLQSVVPVPAPHQSGGVSAAVEPAERPECVRTHAAAPPASTQLLQQTPAEPLRPADARRQRPRDQGTAHSSVPHHAL